MSQTVADILVGTLEQIGVKHIFGLIGDSLNPLTDAIRRSKIEWIGVRHEEGAALAAAGQAKLTGRLEFAPGQPGLAARILSPDSTKREATTRPYLRSPATCHAKCKAPTTYRRRNRSPVSRRLTVHRDHFLSGAGASRHPPGIAAAYAGRGVAHLTLPQDVIGAKADGSVSSVATLKPRPEFVANAADIANIARLIDDAGSVVIMCGAGSHGAAEELRALSDRLKAPLIHSVKGKDIMPYDDPHWMGGIGMIGTKAVYNAVMHCDLLLMLGTDYPYRNSCQQGTVVQVDDRARVLGRRTPTALGVFGSVRPTAQIAARPGQGQDRRQILGSSDGRAKKMGRDAGQAIRSGRSKHVFIPKL